MLSEESEYNPFQSPEVNFEVAAERPRFGRGMNVALFVYLLTMIAGGIFSAIEIRSISLSGIILSIVGVWIAILGWKANFMSAKLLGVSGPIFSSCCFALIFFNDWSPGDASETIPVLIFVYVCLAIFWLMMVFIDTLDKSTSTPEQQALSQPKRD